MPIILLLVALMMLGGCESKAEKAEKKMIDEAAGNARIVPLDSNPINDPFE